MFSFKKSLFSYRVKAFSKSKVFSNSDYSHIIEFNDFFEYAEDVDDSYFNNKLNSIRNIICDYKWDALPETNILNIPNHDDCYMFLWTIVWFDNQPPALVESKNLSILGSAENPSLLKMIETENIDKVKKLLKHHYIKANEWFYGRCVLTPSTGWEYPLLSSIKNIFKSLVNKS